MARRDHRPGSARRNSAIRLGDDERRVLEAAAAQRDEPMTTYIRRVALERARKELAES